MHKQHFSFCLVLPSVVQSRYSSSLNKGSGNYFRDMCGTSTYSYYQALRMDISISSEYGFSSRSSMDTYGLIYNSVFNPFDPSTNHIADNDEDCGDGQFWLQSFLHAETTYILVVSTNTPSVIGTFSIISKGTGNVSFTRLGEFRHYSLNLQSRGRKQQVNTH
jgi:hypothetical protein